MALLKVDSVLCNSVKIKYSGSLRLLQDTVENVEDPELFFKFSC